MKLQKQLLEAVEHKQLRPLDVQFALTVAGDEHPAVTLAAALLSISSAVVSLGLYLIAPICVFAHSKRLFSIAKVFLAAELIARPIFWSSL